MGLSFHCPQCSQAVPALPTQMGQQITCPACKTQFRLSPMLLGGNGQSPATKPPPVAAVAKVAAPPVAPHAATPMVPPVAASQPPVAAIVKAPLPPAVPTAAAAFAPPAAGAPAARLKSPPVAPATPTVPAAPAVQPNVARFIAAASQDSTVQLTADGKLPELALAEATAKKQKSSESNASPLVLGLALVASTVLSILLLVVDFSGGGSSTETVDQARVAIAGYYLDHQGPLLPYQQLLKDAELAHSLGKYDEERECYLRVRDLLWSEGKHRYAGLTGTKSSDRELMRLLAIVLQKEGRRG